MGKRFEFYADSEDLSLRVRAWRAALRVMVLGLAYERIPEKWMPIFKIDCRAIVAAKNRMTREEWGKIVREGRRAYAREMEELRDLRKRKESSR